MTDLRQLLANTLADANRHGPHNKRMSQLDRLYLVVLPSDPKSRWETTDDD